MIRPTQRSPLSLVFSAALFIPFMMGACGDSDPEPSGDGEDADGSGGDESGGGDGDGSPIDTTARTYDADDPKIQFMGRWDMSDPKEPVTSLGASQVTIRFEGDSVTALLDDQFRYNQQRNFWEVVVDGEVVSKAALEKRTDTLELVSGLVPGEHTLTMAMRTEPNIGKGMFRGFTIGGTLLDPPAVKTRRIEVIGDSITAGSGSEAANNSPECGEDAFFELDNGGWGQPYHNAYLSYGGVAARQLDAQVHILGVSGIGLVRNYTSRYDTRPMPEVYDLMFLEEEPDPDLVAAGGAGGGGGQSGVEDERDFWEPSNYVPDVVVLALGTNDFSPGDNEERGLDPRPDMGIDEFAEAYIAFIEKLKGYYPDAHFFGVSSPMLGNGWPNSDDTFRDDHRQAIQDVVSYYEGMGDESVHYVEMSKKSGGCGTHPDVEAHAEMGETLSHEIASVMGW